MKIKVQGKRDAIDVDANDKIMFNGAVYILMTRQIFGGWHWYNPTILICGLYYAKNVMTSWDFLISTALSERD